MQRAFQIAAPPSAAGVKNNAVAAVQAPKWPALDKVKVAEIVATGHSLVDLWEASPVRIEDNASHTENVIDQLFPGNPLLCCGKSAYSFDTKTREEWRGQLSSLQLIVPSPMSKPTGTTKDGKESKHTLDNTGQRRFLVVEFDEGTTDAHAAILMHLAKQAPLVMVVHSGGKSLHGWFYCLGQTDERLKIFMDYAVSLGADKATWAKSQFVRVPDGSRNNGKRQTMYLLNPEPLLPKYQKL